MRRIWTAGVVRGARGFWIGGLLIGLIALPGVPAQAAPSGSPDGSRNHGVEPRPISERVPKAKDEPVVGHIRRALDPNDPGAGRIRIGYEFYPADYGHARRTILAIEGGPGYATTGGRDYYLQLFRPLLAKRNLLLIDARGTGRSGAINCPQLQSYRGNYLRNARRCAKQLGDASDVYGSAFAADDFAAVLDHLSIPRVDVYGDSYGTFLGQTFAVRHPDRVRTLTLDAAYPVAGLDPWYPDLNQALRASFRRVCRRDASCSGDPVRRFAKAAKRLRHHPISGHAYDADGTRRRARVDPGELAYLMGTATYGTTVYQELDAARRAWRAGDSAPLLRIAAEQGYYGGGGPVREYSEGAYLAVACNDYPQLWDRSASPATRRQQYDDAVTDLRHTNPGIFAPFTITDWLTSDWADYNTCLPWSKPSHWVPAVPEPTTYPTTPTLVLVGDLDSITSPWGAQVVAGNFPNSHFVEVANVGHVTALADYAGCASKVVRRFVRTRDPGDTSCAADANPAVRMVSSFPRKARGFPVPAGSGRTAARRAAAAAVHTVGDLFPRWFAMYGTHGRGLRGGTFTTAGLSHVSFQMHRLRLVRDVAVSGHVTWVRRDGTVQAQVRLAGAHTGRLRIKWSDATARAVAKGRVDGRAVRITMTAP